MRAMILAAGRGERMGVLTNDVPKALLRVNDRYLIEYSLLSLVKIGVREIVINVCYRGEQIKDALGNGERYGVDLIYSDEAIALETGGGIFQALPLLGDKPFIVLSCDVITAYPLQQLPTEPASWAHLVLVDNPGYHPRGDFCLAQQRIYYGTEQTYTFGNVGMYRPELFAGCVAGKFRLTELFKKAIANQQLTGEYYNGFWQNIGTEAQLNSVVI